MTADAAIKAMAAPWMCCKCGREHWPHPDDDGSWPHAFQTADRRRPDGDVERYVSGEICRRCLSP
jgi:hypothetical protein